MVFHTCLTLVSVLGHSEIPVTFKGSMQSPSPVTSHPRSVICGRIISHFNAFWKYAGALHIPKYMTSGMYVPWRVWMAALCRSSLARRMLLYPWQMSNLENNVLPWSLSIASHIPGIGLWSRTVQAFTLL